MSEALADISEETDLPLSADEAFHLLLAIQCNAHCIKDGQGRSVALGLFPYTSMLNHSCAPNCYHTFRVRQGEAPVLIMRAVRDISIGEELCYTYVPLYQSTTMRQAQLLSAYSFVCSCCRCRTAAVTGGEREPIPSDSEEDNFPSDDVLSLTTMGVGQKEDITRNLFRASTEVATCQSLLQTAINTGNISAMKSINKKLTAFCSNEEKAGALHICNEIMLAAYTTITKSCYAILNTASPHSAVDTNQTFALGVIGFGALTLGCLLKFTHLRNDDVAELEEMIGKGLAVLRPEAVTATTYPQDADMIDKFVCSNPPHFHPTEFIDVFSVVASTCLRHLSFYWDADPRLTELLHLASKQPYNLFTTGDTLSSAFVKSATMSRFHALT